MKRRRRLILTGAAGVLLLFGGSAYLGHRYPERKGFGSFAELHAFVESPNDLSRGTFYRGDQDGFSYFYHQNELFPNLDLEIPADAWKFSPRFPYTHDRKQWISWSGIEEEGGLGGKATLRRIKARSH